MTRSISWNEDSKYALKFIPYLLWPLGLWPLKNTDYLVNIRYGFAVLTQIFLIYSQTTLVFILPNGDSEQVAHLTLIAVTIMGSAKVVTIKIYVKKLKNVVCTVVDDWSFSFNQDDEKSIMKIFANTGRKIFFLQMTLCYICNLMYFVSALLIPPMTINGTRFEETPMQQYPLTTGLLYGHFRGLKYKAMFIFESIETLICTHGNVGCDLVYFILIMHICGQIEVLKGRIVRLGKEKSDTTKQVVELIVRHQEILRMADDLASIINITMIIQLFMNGSLNLLLGLKVILNIKRHESAADFVNYLTGFVVLMLQLYLISYAGDLMTKQFASIIDAIYQCNWYELPNNLKRNVLFIKMRAMKPVVLTAGKFYIINIENFKSVLKATFSFFSILQAAFDA